MPISEGQAWLDRWKLMNELEEEELRATPPEVSLMQLESLYASIDHFGWREALQEGEAELRDTWIRAKVRYARRTR
ncbi:MAG: hypothetical protein WD872_16350 [Pirellulaceae bacterium]